MLLPLLVNLYIWFGTQLSFAPLLTDLSTLMRMNTAAAERNGLPPAQPVDLLRGLSQIDMRQELARLNFIPTLTMYRTVAADTDLGERSRGGGRRAAHDVPHYDGGHQQPPDWFLVRPGDALLITDGGNAISVYNWGGMLLALVLINGLALPFSALYLTQVAAAVRGDQAALATWLRRIWQAMLAILGRIGIVLGVGLALGLPFMCLIGILLYFSPSLGLFMSGILIILGFWIRIYLGFTNKGDRDQRRWAAARRCTPALISCGATTGARWACWRSPGRSASARACSG